MWRLEPAQQYPPLSPNNIFHCCIVLLIFASYALLLKWGICPFFQILTLHKTFLCRIPSLRKSPETLEAEIRGGKELQMIRTQGRRREVERPPPGTRSPAPGRRKTEVQRINLPRNLTPKSPHPLSPVPRLNLVANQVRNPARARKIPPSWRKLILGREEEKMINLPLLQKKEEFPRCHRRLKIWDESRR